jgi:short-subunit dehydrogenase
MTRQRILITGASSGLGEGMAREFAKQGKYLALCARRIERLEALKIELESAYPACKIWIKTLDVCDAGAVKRVFNAFHAEMGGVERIIINSGIGRGGAIGRGEMAGNIETLNTNLMAFLYQAESAMEIFYAQKHGHLVGISSVSAMRGLPKHMAVYAASKAGVTHIMGGLRLENLNKPYAFTTLHPGFIETEMTKGGATKPFIISLEKAAPMLVSAIEREVSEAFVPTWPWAVLGRLMKYMPDRIVKKLI